MKSSGQAFSEEMKKNDLPEYFNDNTNNYQGEQNWYSYNYQGEESGKYYQSGKYDKTYNSGSEHWPER